MKGAACTASRAFNSISKQRTIKKRVSLSTVILFIFIFYDDTFIILNTIQVKIIESNCKAT
jgi:hypothetical protein